MPQVQYLDRQADPIAAQIASYGNDLADTIQKAQAMRITKMEIDIKRKQAKTEQEKLQWDQVKDFHDFNDKIDLAVGKGELPQSIAAQMKARKIKDFGGFPMLQKYGEVAIPAQELISSGQNQAKQTPPQSGNAPTPEGYQGSTTVAPSESELAGLGPNARVAALKGYSDINLQRAQTNQAQQDANLNSRMQALLQAQGSGNASSTGAPSGNANPVIPSVNIKGINAVFPDAQDALTRQHAMQTQLGQEEANKQIRDQLLNSPSAEEYPVGATISGGGLTYSPNPKLDDTSITAVTGADKFEPLVDKITSLIDSGVLDSGRSRLLTQVLAEGGGNPATRILTKDDTNLEELASAANELGKYAFAEGGKNLTPAEIRTVKGGLSFIGKGDKQIKNDLPEAIDILRKKKIYILGGANVYKYKENSPGANRIRAMQDAERKMPSKPAKLGGKLMQDAQGNRAIVYPDGTIEEQ